MREHDAQDQEQPRDIQHQNLNTDTLLETHITRVLQERAAHVHFTPELRMRVLQRLHPQPKATAQRMLLPVFAAVAALVLIFTLAISFLQQPHMPPVASINYTQVQMLNAPAELANGGQPVAVDPTGKYLVYAPANQPGVFYTASVAKPADSNSLAMRFAHDMAWAPDGSAIVAAVTPEGTTKSLLALVPTGKYMHLLGPDALAASWSPTTHNEITFVKQANGQTELWSTTADGAPAQHLATMNIPEVVVHLYWSPDGQKLALVVTDSTTFTPGNQPARAIYLMDAQSGSVQKIVSPTTGTLGEIAWSPNNRYLSYELNDAQGQTSVHTFDVQSKQERFSITPKDHLMGWSWAPDSSALVYSDGGHLQAYTLQGPKLQFPVAKTAQAYPFWLPNKQILYLSIDNGVGQLGLLAAQQTK